MTISNNELHRFGESVKTELWNNIVPFWNTHCLNDAKQINGCISNDLSIIKNANVSLILTTRLLWTFSTLYRASGQSALLNRARDIYRILMDTFYDKQLGGFYWTLDHRDNPRQ
ncbi:MAG: hypothetical protein U5R06_03300 [candidate division KSB1 bacterium]|nr:hypothetical protein [candidate division KSB1 bacterium]